MAEEKPLTSENLQELNKQHEEHEKRQFACGRCRINWWKVVPVTKPVSRCDVCRTKYDALDKEEEFGIGHHICECGHTFNGFTRYGVTSPCYECGREVLSAFFLTDRNDIKKKTPHRHKCSDCNGLGNCPNKETLVNTSSEHVSTGSTASSVCLESETYRGDEEYDDQEDEDRCGVRTLLEHVSRGIEGLDIDSDTDTE